MKEIVSQFNVIGFTPEQYRQVTQDLKAAGEEKYSARLVHIAAQGTDGLIITDVWESEEALNKFVETLVPILVKNGVTPVQPTTLLPLVNLIEKVTDSPNVRQTDIVI